MISNLKSVLVIAAHPDDEVLGCGGLMARLAQSGTKVTSVFLADGVSSRYEYVEKEAWSKELATRRQAGAKAAEILGSQPPIYYDFSDNQLDQIPLLELAKVVEYHFEEMSPDLVLTHFPGDLNVDHRKVSEAVATAARPGGKDNPPEIWAFEVPSSTEWNLISNLDFTPDIFVDISKHVDQKILALDAYNFEMRAFPHPRSKRAILALMDWRASNSGLSQAESFFLLRKIIK